MESTEYEYRTEKAEAYLKGKLDCANAVISALLEEVQRLHEEVARLTVALAEAKAAAIGAVVERECWRCKEKFMAHPAAKYCSVRCRVAAHRAAKAAAE